MNYKTKVIGGLLVLSSCALMTLKLTINNEEGALYSLNQQGTEPELEYNRESKEELVSNSQGKKILTTEDALKELAARPSEEAPTEPDYDKNALAWKQVDLVALQNETPDNLFWLMAAPTQDPSVLEQREDKRNNLSAQETKIGSNQATESEIRDYYGFQQQLSNDYIEFTSLVLKRYGDVLPEESLGLQSLARSMHLSKLQEYPKKLTAALERREKFEGQRSEWLADKEAYKARLEAQAAEANKTLGKI